MQCLKRGKPGSADGERKAQRNSQPRRRTAVPRIRASLGAALPSAVASGQASVTEWRYCHDGSLLIRAGLLLGPVQGMIGDAEIGVEFVAGSSDRLISELRRGKRGDMIVSRGALKMAGEGIWKVSCGAE